MKRFVVVCVALAVGLISATAAFADGQITRIDLQKSDGGSACVTASTEQTCTIPSGAKEFTVAVDYQGLGGNTPITIELTDAKGNKLSHVESHDGSGTLRWKVTGDAVLANLRQLADPDYRESGQDSFKSAMDKVNGAAQGSNEQKLAMDSVRSIVARMNSAIETLERCDLVVPDKCSTMRSSLTQARSKLDLVVQSLPAAGSPNTGQASGAANEAVTALSAAFSALGSPTNVAFSDDIPFGDSRRTAEVSAPSVGIRQASWIVSNIALPTATPQPRLGPTATESRFGNVPTRTPTPPPAQNNQQPTATTAPAQNSQQPTATTAPAQNNQQPTATTAPSQSSQPTVTAAAVAQAAAPPPAAGQAASGQAASGQAAQGQAAKGQTSGASVVTAAPPPPGATPVPLGGQPAPGAAGATPGAGQKTVGAAPAGATPNATARAASTAAAAGAPATATAAKLAGGVDLSRLTPEAGGTSRVLGQTDRGGLPLLMIGLVVVAAALGGAALWVRRRT